MKKFREATLEYSFIELELTIKNKIQAFEAAPDIVLSCLISGKQEQPGEIVSKSVI
jgi:hypothetical protein